MSNLSSGPAKFSAAANKRRCRHDLSEWSSLRKMHLPWGFLFCRLCGYVSTESALKNASNYALSMRMGYFVLYGEASDCLPFFFAKKKSGFRIPTEPGALDRPLEIKPLQCIFGKTASWSSERISSGSRVLPCSNDIITLGRKKTDGIRACPKQPLTCASCFNRG